MKRRNGKLEHGDRVEVYRNLHNNTFSVRRGGKVVKHLENWMTLHLQDVKFAVQPAGREKVRREGKKNVHAYVRGTVVKAEDHHFKETFKEKCNLWVTYNPYQNDSFISYVPISRDETRVTPIHKANLVTLNQGYVYAAI
jgi:ribosomal protein L31E